MAIRRPSRITSTLDKLLGDLPQLLLGLQAQAERSQLAREEMKLEKDFQMKNLRSEVETAKKEVAMEKEMIKKDLEVKEKSE